MRSSYMPNHIGRDIMATVEKVKPKTVVEFGVLDGYSTYWILKSLQNQWGVESNAKLYSYDLWSEYKYNHGQLEIVKNVIGSIDIYNQVSLNYGNFYDWIKSPPEVDLVHLDISNDGDIVEHAISNLPSGTVLLFEGGSEERDNIDWMKKYQRRPIRSIKYEYTVLNNNFPSLSIVTVP